MYGVLLREGINRDAVMRAMESKGVPSRGYFSPIHLQKYIRDRFGTRPGHLPVTEQVAQRTLALPFHNNLSLDRIDHVISTLEAAVLSIGHHPLTNGVPMQL